MSAIEKLVAVAGWPIDVLTGIAWLAVLYGWEEGNKWRRQARKAEEEGRPIPEPNLWVRYGSPLTYVACALLWLTMIHWGQMQQKPIRA